MCCRLTQTLSVYELLVDAANHPVDAHAAGRHSHPVHARNASGTRTGAAAREAAEGAGAGAQGAGTAVALEAPRPKPPRI